MLQVVGVGGGEVDGELVAGGAQDACSGCEVDDAVTVVVLDAP